MQLSLIYPVYHEPHLEARARELVSFWARFPVDLEIVWIVDPWKDFSLPKIEADLASLQKPERIQFRVLPNQRRLGRGASVLRGLNEARGELLAVHSLDFSIPLGEVFSGLQEFILQREQNFLLIGNRRGRKKKRSGEVARFRRIFEDIEHEKSKSLEINDPTCPFFMLKKKSWMDLGLQNLRRWFYTPAVLQAARKQGLEIRELELNCRDNPKSRLRWWDAFR